MFQKWACIRMVPVILKKLFSDACLKHLVIPNASQTSRPFIFHDIRWFDMILLDLKVELCKKLWLVLKIQHSYMDI